MYIKREIFILKIQRKEKDILFHFKKKTTEILDVKNGRESKYYLGFKLIPL